MAQIHRVPPATWGWMNGPVLTKGALITTKEFSMPLGLVRKVRLESSMKFRYKSWVKTG